MILPRLLTSSSSAAASRASRPRTSCHRRERVRSSCSSALARAGGVILSEEVDGFTIDGGPDAAARSRSPKASRSAKELGLGDRLVSTKPPRLAYIQRGGRLHALPAASVLGIPTRVGPFLRTRLFSLARQAPHGRRAVRAAAPDGQRRIDWRVHDAALRRGGDDLSGGTAARRHSRGRRRPAVDPRAVSALRRRGAEARQPAEGLPSSGAKSRTRRHGRRLQVAARRPERDGARPGRSLLRPTRCVRTQHRRATRVDGRRPVFA